MRETTSEKRPGDPVEIGCIYALITIGPDCQESLTGMMTEDRLTLQICTELAQVDTMHQLALNIGIQSGHTVRFVRFDRAEVIRTIEPIGGSR
jgi:hypothetical protein